MRAKIGVAGYARLTVACLIVMVVGVLVPSTAAAIPVFVSVGGANKIAPYEIGAGGGLTATSCSPASNCETGSGAEGVAVDPTGRYVYTANFGAETVSPFAVGAGGSLTPIPCTPASNCGTGAEPEAIAVDPTGRYVYVANDSGSVSPFAIGAGGALTPIPCSPASNCTAGANPQGIAIGPTGRYVYVVNESGSVSVFSIGSGGRLTPVSCDPSTNCMTGTSPGGVAIDPAGHYLYVSNEGSGNISVFAIGSGGSLTPIPCSHCYTGGEPDGIAITPAGHYLYAANSTDEGVDAFSIGSGGALTPITCADCGTGSGAFAAGVAVDPSGRYVYVSTYGVNSVEAFSIGSGGALTPSLCSTACDLSGEPNFFSVAVGPDRGPTASFSSAVGAAGTTTTFNASSSTSPDYPITDHAWSFGDGSTLSSSGATASHVYARPGRYTVTLGVVDQVGCSQSVVYTGQTASCDGSAKAISTRVITVSAPTLSGLRLSPRTFPLAGRRVRDRCVKQTHQNRGHAACKRSIRVTIGYVLNAPSSVELTITRRLAGRRVHRRCVAPTRHNRAKQKCTRSIAVRGAITLTGKAGSNSYAFKGRIGGHKLGPGSYVLKLTPAGGTSRTATLRITG